MRSERQIMDTILGVVKSSDNIRVPASNDSMYNVAKPTAEQFAGCCNEFYWCMNNVAKGIARRQLPYAMWMYNSVVHPMLIKLLSYRAAI